MFDIKKKLMIFTFISACMSVVLYSFFGELDDKKFKRQKVGMKRKNKKSYSVNNVELYVVKKGSPVIKLESILLNVVNDNTFDAQDPIGIVYTKDGNPVNYAASRGFVNQSKGTLLLNENVTLKTQDSVIKSDKMTYGLNNDLCIATGNVRTRNIDSKNGDLITVSSNELESYPKSGRFKYKGSVSGKIKRKLVYEPPVYFKSNNLYLNTGIYKADLSGAVNIKKETLDAYSHRGEIFLNNYNKKLKYFVLYDDVQVYEKVFIGNGPEKKSYVRKAFSEKLEGIVSLNKIILSGYPKVFQESDVIKGNIIILRGDTEVVEVMDANTNFILKK